MSWPDGRRRPDLPLDRLHADLEPGDYWKILNSTGEPRRSPWPENLTGTCWYAVIGMTYGYAIAHLEKHTVREEDDDTISVRPNDGSSNSILITGHHGEQWHGYVEHGVFRAV